MKSERQTNIALVDSESAARSARQIVQRILAKLPSCHGACNQGDQPCPTPQACRLPEISDPDWTDMAWFWSVTLGPILLVVIGALAAVLWPAP